MSDYRQCREAIPERLRSCETVDEAKRLRDSIEMHRLNNVTEVNVMRNKQQLFQEYCVFKNKFVISNANELSDLHIQKEILDETWAKWIQDFETRAQELNDADLIEELRRNIEECSIRTKRFESDNIFHIMKFGACRMMNGDFKGASKFYDQVIRMDPAWSAFAHYNRAYCTIQMKGDGYIRSAIDDLKATLCQLEIHNKRCLFSEIYVNAAYEQKHAFNHDCSPKLKENIKSTQFYTMMENQLFHHIDTEITDTIEKLETIDTRKGEVKTVRRRDILALIPGADSRTEKMLQEYRQLGLLFTYNIDVEPQFCYRSQIVSSLVMLESVADFVLMGVFNGTLVIGRSMKLKDTVDAVLCMQSTSDESLGWMSRCVSRKIMTGIHSIDFIRDVSWLVPIEQTEVNSSYKMARETSQFTQYANSQARYISELIDSLKHEISKCLSCQEDEIVSHVINVTMGVLEKKIQLRIQEKLVTEEQFHRELCCLYSSVTSQSRSDHQQYLDYIRDLVQRSAYSSKSVDADIRTAALENIAVELMLKFQTGNITATDLLGSNTSKITAAAEKIEIGTALTKFSEFLCHKLNMFSQKSKTDKSVCNVQIKCSDVSCDMMKIFSHESTTDGCVCDDVQMLEATNKVLTSEWSGIIRGMLQYRITRSMMFDIRERMDKLFASIKDKLTDSRDSIQYALRNTRQYKPSTDWSIRLREYINIKKSGGPPVRSKTVLRMISKYSEQNIIILDVDKEQILTVSPAIRDSIELIYNPPCSAYPGGHFDAYVEGKVVEAQREDPKDYYLLRSAIFDAMNGFNNPWIYHIAVGECIDEIPSVAGRLLISDEYARQLKRGRALLRFYRWIIQQDK